MFNLILFFVQNVASDALHDDNAVTFLPVWQLDCQSLIAHENRYCIFRIIHQLYSTPYLPYI